MTAPDRDPVTVDLHRHWFAFHRHPKWHGHCPTVVTHPDAPGTRLVGRDVGGDVLSLPGGTYSDIELRRYYGWRWHREHSCLRWHFHLPFTHRHTETGR